MDGIAGSKDFSDHICLHLLTSAPLFGDNGMQRVLSIGELKNLRCCRQSAPHFQIQTGDEGRVKKKSRCCCCTRPLGGIKERAPNFELMLGFSVSARAKILYKVIVFQVNLKHIFLHNFGPINLFLLSFLDRLKLLSNPFNCSHAQCFIHMGFF